jgi:hypothetical protein
MKLKRLLIMYFFVLGLFILLNKSIYAQSDSSDAKQSADEIAKILSDPNATIGKLSFPIDFITYAGDLPGAGDQSSYLTSLVRV